MKISPSDHDLQKAVQDELDWTPDVNASRVGVSVKDGAVSLSGEVDSRAEQVSATRAALRVHGALAVVDDLVVHPRSRWTLTDTDVAREVAHALARAGNVPDTVKAEVKDHAVTLTGTVDWDYQRQAAQSAVDYLQGVASVANEVTLAARRPATSNTRVRISQALARNAQLVGRAIEVSVSGNAVTLTGTVRSLEAKQVAGRIAWSSPEISMINNDLQLDPA